MNTISQAHTLTITLKEIHNWLNLFCHLKEELLDCTLEYRSHVILKTFAKILITISSVEPLPPTAVSARFQLLPRPALSLSITLGEGQNAKDETTSSIFVVN